MKVILTIELDIPDDADMLDDDIEQVLYDSYINYVPLMHSRDALYWLGQGDKAWDLYNVHQNWSEITTDPKWSFKVEGH